MTTVRLPLFPLNSVLFPGLVLPLNVFEERYRAMMRDLLKTPEEEPRRFAVVAIRDGHEVAPSAPGMDSACSGCVNEPHWLAQQSRSSRHQERERRFSCA